MPSFGAYQRTEHQWRMRRWLEPWDIITKWRFWKKFLTKDYTLGLVSTCYQKCLSYQIPKKNKRNIGYCLCSTLLYSSFVHCFGRLVDLVECWLYIFNLKTKFLTLIFLIYHHINLHIYSAPNFVSNPYPMRWIVTSFWGHILVQILIRQEYL